MFDQTVMRRECLIGTVSASIPGKPWGERLDNLSPLAGSAPTGTS